MATAINLYLVEQGVQVSGTCSVSVTGQVYVAQGFVTQGNKRLTGKGETLYSFEVNERTHWIPEVPHNGTVEYKGLLFLQYDATPSCGERRSASPVDVTYA